MKNRGPLASGKVRLVALATGMAAIGLGCFFLHESRQSSRGLSFGPSTPSGTPQADCAPAAAGQEEPLPQKASSRGSEAGNIRTRSNEDGTTDEFRRSENRRILTRTTRNASGTLESQIIYRVSAEGRIQNARIFDSKGVQLAEARYGYSKKEGEHPNRITEEQVFDTRQPHTYQSVQGELPVRRVLYTYDADGSRNPPALVDLGPQSDAQNGSSDLAAIRPSALVSNPFDDTDPAASR